MDLVLEVRETRVVDGAGDENSSALSSFPSPIRQGLIFGKSRPEIWGEVHQIWAMIKQKFMIIEGRSSFPNHSPKAKT